MIVRRCQNNAVTLSGAYQAVSNHPLKSVYLDGVRLPAPSAVFTGPNLQTRSQRRSERSHNRLWTLGFLTVSTGCHFFGRSTGKRSSTFAHADGFPGAVGWEWDRRRYFGGIDANASHLQRKQQTTVGCEAAGQPHYGRRHPMVWASRVPCGENARHLMINENRHWQSIALRLSSRHRRKPERPRFWRCHRADRYVRAESGSQLRARSQSR